MKLTYAEAQEKEEVLKSMTSLTRLEFEELVVDFEKALHDLLPKDPSKGGRPPSLSTVKDQLFFILFYMKTYPLQEILGFLFGMDQAQANEWIYKLTPVLRKALQIADSLPTRKSEALLALLQEEDETPKVSIDGTERRRNRPQNQEQQRAYYSGKKKAHTVKNDVIVGMEDIQIKYLSDTKPGKVNDKKIADQAQLSYPQGTELYQDKGLQGYEPKGVTVFQPKKKPKGGELTEEEKQKNRAISSARVVVEHVIGSIKRLHIVADVFRNRKPLFDDQVIEIACGLHNFRTNHRLLEY